MKKAKIASLVLMAGCVSQGYAAWWNPVSWFRSAKPAELQQAQDSVPEELLCATPPTNPSLSGSTVYSYTNFHLDAQDAYGYSIKWNSLGPVAKRDQDANTIATGKVTEIIPLSSTRILAGMQGSGVWRTINANAVDVQGRPAVTWSPLDQNMASLSTKSVAVNPRNTSQIMVGTGMAAMWIREGNAAGIQYSSNGGSTWTQLSFFQSPMSNGHWVSAVNSLLAVKGSGTITRWIAAIGSAAESVNNPKSGTILQSTNNGATWIEAVINVPQGQTKYNYREIFSLAEVKGATKTILYGIANTTDGDRIALLRSDDSGQSWMQRTTLVTNKYLASLRIAASAANPERVYFAGTDGLGNRIAYRSIDGGSNFQATIIPLSFGKESGATSIWVDPLNPDVVVVGGTTMARSMDGGLTFQEMVGYSTQLHPDVWALTSVYGYSSTNRGLLVGTDGGLWRIKDVHATPWVIENFSEGMSTLFGHDISVSPNHVITLSTWDNGTWHKQPGKEWQKAIGGDGWACAYTQPLSGWYCGDNKYARHIGENHFQGRVHAFNIANSATFANGVWTRTGNGILAPQTPFIAGERFFNHFTGSPYTGVYEVLDPGSATTPWKIRRPSDMDEVKQGEITGVMSASNLTVSSSYYFPPEGVLDQTLWSKFSAEFNPIRSQDYQYTMTAYKDGSAATHVMTPSSVTYYSPSLNRNSSVAVPFSDNWIFYSKFNPHNGDLWVAGTPGNMGYFERSSDPGWEPAITNFKIASPKADNNPGGVSTSIEFDPLNPNKVYMTRALAVNSVWAKENYQIQADDTTYWGWKCIGGLHNGMSNLWVNHIVAHPSNPDMLFVGTRVGMMVSFDGGRTWGQKNAALNRWVVGNEGPGNAEIRKMQFVGDTLYLGTYGRGAWSAKIPTYPNVF